MGCDFDLGDMLPGLSLVRSEGAEACFDGVVLSGQHRVGHRILDGDDKVCMLGRGVLLGARNAERFFRGSSKGVGGPGVWCLEFHD